jgi:hypothetical protein
MITAMQHTQTIKTIPQLLDFKQNCHTIQIFGIATATFKRYAKTLNPNKKQLLKQKAYTTKMLFSLLLTTQLQNKFY